MTKYKNIYLKKGKEESLRRFHPWVFSGAINNKEEGIEEGDTVRIFTDKGEFIAVGHYQVGSISVRILSFKDEQIDQAFWHRKLEKAYRMRQSLGFLANEMSDTYRLVHGEGDGIPGLVIDIYGQTAVMQAHSVGIHLCRKSIAQAIVDVMNGTVSNVFYKSETTLPFKADLGQEDEFLVGKTDYDVAMENGLRFHVDWLKGQKTGFFVDQRENRRLVERLSKGKKVLNMFCYTGGFSLYAMRGGAEEVCSVDSSQKAIDLTEKNIELNFPGDKRHKAVCDDAFKYLDREGDGYDLIILDPPAFAKHRGAVHNALKGYIRLNNKAIEKIKSGGLIVTFSCSQVITKDNFRNAVFTASALSHRSVRILQQLHQPSDHPINIYHPEGEYLKGLLLYVE